MKKLKTWTVVIILLLTYTLCPMKQTYASDLDTTHSETTENER